MASSGASEALSPAGRRVIVTGARGGIGRAVVANAGVVDTIHRAELFPEEDWQQDLQTNLSGQFHVVRAAFESLRESGDGRVVVVSSASAETGLPGQVAYTAAKAGLVGMIRTWPRNGAATAFAATS